MMNANEVEILLVEDNPTDAELTRRALERYNFGQRLIVVRDGAEALDFIFCKGAYQNRTSTNSLKFVLLDLKLPKVSGIEVLLRVKTDPRTKTLPVIVLTSSKEERDILESYKLGANSYIVKPVEFDKFVNALAEIGLYWMKMNQGTH